MVKPIEKKNHHSSGFISGNSIFPTMTTIKLPDSRTNIAGFEICTECDSRKIKLPKIFRFNKVCRATTNKNRYCHISFGSDTNTNEKDSVSIIEDSVKIEKSNRVLISRYWLL